MLEVLKTDSERLAQQVLGGMWDKVHQHSGKKIMHLSGPVLAAASGAILITARTAKVAELIFKGLGNILASPFSGRRSNGESRLWTGVKQIAAAPLAAIGVAFTILEAITDVFKLTHGMARRPDNFPQRRKDEVQLMLDQVNGLI